VRAIEFDEDAAMMAGDDLPQLAAYRPPWMQHRVPIHVEGDILSGAR
jgi:hypothetical protein